MYIRFPYCLIIMIILSLLLSELFSPSYASNRFALVIGNGAYDVSPLANAVNDARLIGDTLARLDFSVIMMENLNWREMNEAITSFSEGLRNMEVGLFYYAGHGVQFSGKNFLIPVGSGIRHEKELVYKAIDAERILAEMSVSESHINIIILDACRDNTLYRSFRNTATGLAYMSAPTNSIIAYSTGPGKKASDGANGNSDYTVELAKFMVTPDMRLVDVFSNVRKAVRIKTKGVQIPWESTSLECAFMFNPTEPRPECIDVNLFSDYAVVQNTVPQLKEKREVIDIPKKMFPSDDSTMPQKKTASMLFKADASDLSVPSSKEPFKETAVGMEFVWTPGGCYQMGCGEWAGECDDDEKPLHEVCVDDFWMGKFEVTNREFVIFLNDARDRGPEGEAWFLTKDEDPRARIMGYTGNYRVEKGYEYHPVTMVSWYGATAFAKWLSKKNNDTYRLPTEAEWEYAARACGQFSEFAGGDDIDLFGWYSHNSVSTHPVGLNSPNLLGIFDMSGNVWEWCFDIYVTTAYKKHGLINPVIIKVDESIAGSSARVIRGGSWRYLPARSRCSNRGNHGISKHTMDLGFRLVRSTNNEILQSGIPLVARDF